MNKIILALLLLVFPLVAQADNTSDMMGLGLPAELAAKIGGAIGDSVMSFTASSYAITANSSNGSDSKALIIGGGGGGTATDSGRGGYASFIGNENLSNPGDVTISAGNLSGGELYLTAPNAGGIIYYNSASHQFRTEAGASSIAFGSSATTPNIRGGTVSLQINNNANSVANMTIADAGPITVRDTLVSSGTNTFGWSVVDGTDNTTCVAQCTSAAVFGLNLAAGATAPVIVGPSDATADICLCAGAS